MKNKKGVVLSLLMSLLVSGGSAVESGKGNNSKGGSNVTLDNRKNIETGKTVAGYTITAILALFLGYKIGNRKEDVNAKEIQKGEELNKCCYHACERKGAEFKLKDNVYICRNCFSILCFNCQYGLCKVCNSSGIAMKIEEFVKKPDYIPALRNIAVLAKYRFVMKAQEEQKKQNEELAKKANNLDNIINI